MTFEALLPVTHSCYRRVAWQALPCSRQYHNVGFKRRATAMVIVTNGL